MSLISKDRCYVCGCSREAMAMEGIYFHQIPQSSSTEDITNRWLAFLHLPPKSYWGQDIWKEICLCSRHFVKEVYKLNDVIHGALKKGASPTLLQPKGPGVLGTLFSLELPQMSSEGGLSGSQAVHQVVEDQPSAMDTIEEEHLCIKPVVDPSVSTPDIPIQGAISKFLSGVRKPNFKSKLGLIKRRSNSSFNYRSYQIWKAKRDNYLRSARSHYTSQLPGDREWGDIRNELLSSLHDNYFKSFHERRYPNRVNAVCLALHELSLIAYQLIRQEFSLPSPSALNHIRKSVPLSTGIPEVVLDSLTKRLSSMSEIDKICVLMFGEISLARHLDYDHTKDHILGYQDIAGNRHPCFADHALVFMVRGLMSDWKQPLAVHLGQAIRGGALENLVRETVVALQNVGLKVVAIVSDRAQSVSAFPSLATTSGRDDSTIKIGDELILIFADAPHLLKVLRNNFLKYDVQFKGEDDKIKVAKFNVFQEFLEYEKMKFVSHIYGYKISERHLHPNSKDKIEVKLAAQLLSQKVSAEIQCFGFTTGNSSASDLAEFLWIVDRMFDTFNSSAPKGDKLLRCCVTGDSKHHAFWNDLRESLADWKFVVRSPSDKKPRTKCFQFWQRNIASVQSLWRKVRDLGMPRLKTRNLTQVPLESFFGRIRQQGGGGTIPTSRCFLDSYKILMVDSFTANIHRKRSNVAEHLALLTSLLNSKFHSRGDVRALETSGVGNASSSIASVCSVSKDVEGHTDWIGKLCNEATEGVVGFALDLLISFVRDRSNYLFLSSCFQCFKSVYTCNHSSPSQGRETCGLCSKLNSSLAASMYKIFLVVLNNLREIGHKHQLSEELKASVRDVPLHGLSCSEHRNQLKEMILTFIVESAIYVFCERVNSSLKSARKSKPRE